MVSVGPPVAVARTGIIVDQIAGAPMFPPLARPSANIERSAVVTDTRNAPTACCICEVWWNVSVTTVPYGEDAVSMIVSNTAV